MADSPKAAAQEEMARKLARDAAAAAAEERSRRMSEPTGPTVAPAAQPAAVRADCGPSASDVSRERPSSGFTYPAGSLALSGLLLCLTSLAVEMLTRAAADPPQPPATADNLADAPPAAQAVFREAARRLADAPRWLAVVALPELDRIVTPKLSAAASHLSADAARLNARVGRAATQAARAARASLVKSTRATRRVAAELKRRTEAFRTHERTASASTL